MQVPMASMAMALRGKTGRARCSLRHLTRLPGRVSTDIALHTRYDDLSSGSQTHRADLLEFNVRL